MNNFALSVPSVQSLSSPFSSPSTNKNYTDYRCVSPTISVTDTKWFPMTDVCPCDPTLSNPTGRGFTPCPMGITFDKQDNKTLPLSALKNNNGNWVATDVTELPPGSMYPVGSYVAPQLQPRMLTRIGQTWRS